MHTDNKQLLTKKSLVTDKQDLDQIEGEWEDEMPTQDKESNFPEHYDLQDRLRVSTND